MKDYVKSYKVGGQRYNYLRPPADLAEKLGTPRLSSEIHEAQLQARGLVSLARTGIKSVKASSPVADIALKIIANARSRGYRRWGAFDLSPEFIASLLVSQSLRCAISGIHFDFETKPRHRGDKVPFRPSLDRIDASRGYAQDNVRLVCTIANFAMGAWGEAALVRLAIAITTKNKNGTKHGSRPRLGPHEKPLSAGSGGQI